MFTRRTPAIFLLLAFGPLASAQGLLPIGPEDLDEALLQPLYVDVTAVDKATGKPLAGVDLTLKSYVDRSRYEDRTQSDDAGEGRLDLPESGKMSYVAIEGRLKGYVPIYMRWDGRNRKLEAPDKVRMEFEPAVSIGGTVVDEAGKPVKGVPVEVYIPATRSSMGNSFVFDITETRTDEQGRWQSDTAPNDMSHLNVSFKHPDYLRNYIHGSGQKAALLKKEHVLTLQQGLSIRGIVQNEAGEPIEGARLIFGPDRFGSNLPKATTDEAGRFTLRNCKEGSLPVTVQADGYAPDLQLATAGKDRPEIVFKLGPPAKLRGKLVDPDGKPIAGAFFAADTWRGHRCLEYRINTDSEGRFTWDNAPHDDVQYDMGKQGYISVRNRVIPADGEEQTIVMQPEVNVTGTVVDAAGKPVETFRVIIGRKYRENSRLYFNRDYNVSEFTRGEFELKFDEPAYMSQLLIEAEGYRPIKTESFKLADGNRHFDLTVEQGQPLTGKVIDNDGQPVVDANVVLLAEDANNLSLRNGAVDRAPQRPHTKTDSAGEFQFAEQTGPLVLAVFHKSGVAGLLTNRTGGKVADIKLRPWGRIEGTVMRGSEAGAGQRVDYYSRDSSRNSLFVPGIGGIQPDLVAAENDQPQSGVLNTFQALSESLAPAASALMNSQENKRASELLRKIRPRVWDNRNMITDQQGKFVFERVAPGQIGVSRQIVVPRGNGSTHYTTHPVHVELAAGETAKVTLGGEGVPVIGKIEAGLPDERPVVWGACPPVELRDTTKNVPGRLLGRINPDGTFRVSDVPPGTYELKIEVVDPSKQDQYQRLAVVGLLRQEVTVPPMPQGVTVSDEPIDLGTLEPEKVEPKF